MSETQKHRRIRALIRRYWFLIEAFQIVVNDEDRRSLLAHLRDNVSIVVASDLSLRDAVFFRILAYETLRDCQIQDLDRICKTLIALDEQDGGDPDGAEAAIGG